MKPLLIPRIVLVLFFALVALIFLTGTLRAFNTAHAAIQATVFTGGHPTAGASTPTSAGANTKASADTTGIIALTIVVVAIILAGAALGRWKPCKKNFHQD